MVPWGVIDVHTDADSEHLTGSLLDEKSGQFFSATHQIVGPAKSRVRHTKLPEGASK